MFELNEQELEQVAGGRRHYASHSSAGGEGFASIGAVSSETHAGSRVTHHSAESFASNTTEGIGYHVGVSSSAETAAGAGY